MSTLLSALDCFLFPPSEHFSKIWCHCGVLKINSGMVLMFRWHAITQQYYNMVGVCLNATWAAS